MRLGVPMRGGYAEADITVESADGPPEVTLGRVMEALEAHLLRGHASPAGQQP